MNHSHIFLPSIRVEETEKLTAVLYTKVSLLRIEYLYDTAGHYLLLKFSVRTWRKIMNPCRLFRITEFSVDERVTNKRFASTHECFVIGFDKSILLGIYSGRAGGNVSELGGVRVWKRNLGFKEE